MFCLYAIDSKLQSIRTNIQENNHILSALPDQVFASDMRDICYAALINDIVENNRSSQKLKHIAKRIKEK